MYVCPLVFMTLGGQVCIDIYAPLLTYYLTFRGEAKVYDDCAATTHSATTRLLKFRTSGP